MIPPRDVGIEIDHQLLRRRKVVRLFRRFRVPVITPSALIVVAQHALTGNDVRKPILELMRGRWDRLRNLPHHHFDERVYSDNNPAPKQRYGLHVGENTNT
jgi:hypothetical protein